MTEFDVLRAAAAGMDAQRVALDVAARNVAAAETGGTFARLVPRFRVASSANQEPDLAPNTAGEPQLESLAFEATAGEAMRGEVGEAEEAVVRFIGTTTQPGVAVDAVTEMVAVLNAQRAYEADASVFDAGKRLAERTIDVGRL